MKGLSKGTEKCLQSSERCGKMFSEKDSSSINFDSLNIEMPPAEVRRLYLTELHWTMINNQQYLCILWTIS